jgi:RNA polymerase sigma factor (sigma-70 family)
MGERKLDRLFLRFRKRGDAAALGEVFDRTAPELLKLAMHLVRDPVEAEDVVQSTFLAAIEGAQSYDATRQLMPWLVGILARQAGLVRRRARRVVEPDRLGERSADDPADLAQAQEFSEELKAALEALPETYREVLRLHLADGKRPVEIAQDLKRAPGTVRMQMHRGLDLLRKSLPAGFAAAGVGAVLQTRGLAAIREQVLSSASGSVAAGPLPGTALGKGAGSSLALGGATLTLRLALVAGAGVLAAALVWRIWNAETAPAVPATVAERGTVERESARAKGSPLEAGDARTALAVEPPRFSAADSADPKLRATLRGRVTGVAPGEMDGVRLLVRGIARFEWPEEVRVEGRPAANGEFELEVTRLFEAGRPKRPLEELLITAEHPRFLKEEARIPVEEVESVEAGERTYRAELALALAGVVCGRVETPAPRRGRRESASDATEGTLVALYALLDGVPSHPPVDQVACLADGSFCLRGRAEGEHVVVAVSRDAEPSTSRVTLAPGARVDLDPIELAAGASIEGSAFQLGVPLPEGALVSATPVLEPAAADGGAPSWFPLAGRRLLWNGRAFERGGAIVETEADGSFHIDGLSPRAYRLRVSRAAQEAPSASPTRTLLSTLPGTTVIAPAAQVRILAELATIHLRLGTGDGAPGKRARIHWSQGGDPSQGLDFQLARDGECDVCVVPDRECVATVEAEGCVTQTLTWLAPHAGEEMTRTVLLAKDPQLARLSVRIETGEPFTELTEASFLFTPISGEGSLREGAAFARRATLEDGGFTVAGLPAGRWSVAVHAGDEYLHYRDFWCPAKLEVSLFPGAQADHSVRLRRGGRVRLSVLDSDGNRLAAECVVRTARGDPLEVSFLARRPEGASSDRHRLSALAACDVLPVLPAGDYDFELRVEGCEPLVRRVRVEARRCAQVREVLARGVGAR